MNSSSSTWLSRHQTIVWLALAVAVLLLIAGYYLGAGSSRNDGVATMDSALIEESRLDIAADTALMRDIPETKIETKAHIKTRNKPRVTPRSRDYLGEEVPRPH